MFDLDYYNEIIDFGKAVDRVLEQSRKSGTLNPVKCNNSKVKISNTKRYEYEISVFMEFVRKHQGNYYDWYVKDTYDKHLKKIGKQYNLEKGD